jgi:hypothetical protein
MAPRYGPFASGSGSTLTEDFWYGVLGPMLQHSGVAGTYGSTAMQVYSPVSGLKVFVRAGNGLVRGVGCSLDTDYEIDFAANSSGQSRIDRVVLRMDPTAHTCLPGIVQGTAGAGVAPALTQVVGGVWEIPLANVTIPASATTGTSIATGAVIDNRQYLPMPIRQFYSANGMPPTDGSFGGMAWDSTTGRPMTLRGGTWQYVAVDEVDSGWQNIGLPPSPYWTGGACAYRVIGQRVHWEFRASGGTIVDVQIAPLSLAPRPEIVPQGFPVTCYDLSGNLLGEVWQCQVKREDTAIRLSLTCLVGPGDVTNRTFMGNFSYLMWGS